ncbi:hypothetical protein B5K06_23740 [Rhizobium grahamii]|uniref:Uncharacterized protein n=2 Tax=Rhizobium grahamii TaxID=1120045 RepID=S3HMR4_9HYPH|nr:hypothetical protein RGCCGE502_29298 [Rhizobium grahamii CCGE 502]RDJ06191.1 hypothetical protein B5K06_23740 [Rhizobium grahamii]
MAGGQTGGEGPNDWQVDIIAKGRAIYRDARRYIHALKDAHCHAPPGNASGQNYAAHQRHDHHDRLAKQSNLRQPIRLKRRLSENWTANLSSYRQ